MTVNLYAIGFWLLVASWFAYGVYRIYRLFNNGTIENENKKYKDTIKLTRKIYEKTMGEKLPDKVDDMADYLRIMGGRQH
jgi:hypothetical protein